MRSRGKRAGESRICGKEPSVNGINSTRAPSSENLIIEARKRERDRSHCGSRCPLGRHVSAKSAPQRCWLPRCSLFYTTSASWTRKSSEGIDFLTFRLFVTVPLPTLLFLLSRRTSSIVNISLCVLSCFQTEELRPSFPLIIELVVESHANSAITFSELSIWLSV